MQTMTESEGYPGIAHDFETMRLECTRLREINAELLAALQSCVHLAERNYRDLQSTEFAAGASARLKQVHAAIQKAKR